jgi:hypothetical protein
MLDETDQEHLYRYQILQAFGLEQWDDEVIDATIQELYTQVAPEEVFQLIFSKARENKQIKEALEMLAYAEGNAYADTDNEMVFQLLFKFEFFDLFHRCLVDFLHRKNIAEPVLNKLLFAL